MPDSPDAPSENSPGLGDGLAGRVAVVTGGSSGIGRAAAELLARAGARVYVADLNQGDGPGEFVRTDITEPEAVRALGERVLCDAGAPGVLVNAAGWDEIRPFVESNDDFIARIIEINLIGCMKITRAFLPAMIEAGGGKIVNVSSDAGRVGSSGETVYAGAKGGIIAFSKSVAREVARVPIHVNCVCPGPTDTPLFASLPEKLRVALQRAIPMGRLARPREVAEAIVFLAGSRSDYMTGQVLSVSGGLTMAG